MTTVEPRANLGNLPFTRDEYLESLRDGREIWIYGERVKDVTAHPAFRNSARSVARLYDALHDPEHQGVLTVETDTGNGGFTHPFFKVPYTNRIVLPIDRPSGYTGRACRTARHHTPAGAP